MNAAAWIALFGAIVIFTTNVILITRFLTRLESRFDVLQAQWEGKLNVADAGFKALTEKINTDLGRLQTDLAKLENRYGARLDNLERIAGRSIDLRKLDDG